MHLCYMADLALYFRYFTALASTSIRPDPSLGLIHTNKLEKLNYWLKKWLLHSANLEKDVVNYTLLTGNLQSMLLELEAISTCSHNQKQLPPSAGVQSTYSAS